MAAVRFGCHCEVSPALPYPEPLWVTGPLLSLVLRVEDMWRKHNHCHRSWQGSQSGFPLLTLTSGKNSRYFHTQKGMKQTHKGMKNHCFSRKHVFHTLKRHFIPLWGSCIPCAHFSYLGHIFHTLCICFIPWYYNQNHMVCNRLA